MIKTGRARLGRSRSFRVRGSRDLPSGFYFGPGEGVERGTRKKGWGQKGVKRELLDSLKQGRSLFILQLSIR